MCGTGFPGISRGFDSPLAQFLQFIEAGGAFSYVFEQVRELSVHWKVHKLRQYFAAWTAEALRIRKIPVHDVFERVHQIFFRVHNCGRIETASSRIPRSEIGVDENLCVHSLRELHTARIFPHEITLAQTHSSSKSGPSLRHIPVSPPCIDRRGCGDSASPILRQHGRTEAGIGSSHFPLAGGSA
jgi:hypothetical protein